MCLLRSLKPPISSVSVWMVWIFWGHSNHANAVNFAVNAGQGWRVDRKTPHLWLFRFKRLVPESASQIEAHLLILNFLVVFPFLSNPERAHQWVCTLASSSYNGRYSRVVPIYGASSVQSVQWSHYPRTGNSVTRRLVHP